MVGDEDVNTFSEQQEDENAKKKTLHDLKIFMEFLESCDEKREIVNKYSPKWRWLMMDIYLAASRFGKYPRLATDTEVNSSFSIY